MNWHELLLLPENLLWAWRKARRCYAMADALYDHAELAEFELNLESELESIRRDFESGQWIGEPIRLLPLPKKPDKNGKPRFRQYFQVSVRDQVGWIALVNVLGPELDQKMPAWSYGNRLYRAAWYDEEPDDAHYSKLNIGPYRHSSGHLYRRFKHSWPLFRRHVSLTARKMVVGDFDESELDLGERLALSQSSGLSYLDSGYWNKPTEAGDTLFAVSLDLKKFYPSVRSSAIVTALEKYVDGFLNQPQLRQIVDQMLAFKVDVSGVSVETRSQVEPNVEPGAFDRIPTGLFVGGFLANVAMLPVDSEVDALVKTRRDIAQFRFVDDHQVIAYDFNALLEWLPAYADLLARHKIGAEIETEKYVPPELGKILHPDSADSSGDVRSLIAMASKAAELSGRRPVQFMTRTLAQVSMLAAADFDLLTDAGRSQRLEQLEWLLLANIPDQEIRGDTRMAFASARIAALTPSLFRQSDDLLTAHRALASLSKKKSVSDLAEAEKLKSQIEVYEVVEANEWKSLTAKHFSLLNEAFATHPDKVRLFTRLIDYCRTTGFDGLPEIVGWMVENDSDELKLLVSYLGAVALHSMARHVLTASVALRRQELLHREREAARRFLVGVARSSPAVFVPLQSGLEPLQYFQISARDSFVAALVLSAKELEDTNIELSRGMSALAEQYLGPRDIAELSVVTGVSVGIWYHWFFTTTGAYRDRPPSYWSAVAKVHRPAERSDWSSLRRYPAELPESGWVQLNRNPQLLRVDDAGWLLEAARANPIRLDEMRLDTPIVAAVRRCLATEVEGRSLVAWVSYINGLKDSDPRRSEWAALELVRQILKSLTDIDGPAIDILDRLHPENIRIPAEWYRPGDDAKTDGKIGWDGWRRVVRLYRVEVLAEGISDYRFGEMLEWGGRSWRTRLRSLGQLLWGLLRGSFELPAAWNIRGQERSLLEIVTWDLARLQISSFTLSILQECLLPRSNETSLLTEYPSLFGNLSGQAAIDTEFDSPIASVAQFIERIEKAQEILEHCQITVLEHEPRQLIPVRVRQLGAFGDGALATPEING